MRTERLSPAALLVALAVAAPACNSDKAYVQRPDGAVMDPRPCEDEPPNSRAGHEARGRACRELCNEGSRAHCEVWSRVCLGRVGGSLLCPKESVTALAKACDLGSAGSCLSAGKSLESGEHGVKVDAARGAALSRRACQLDPTLCFRVDPKVAEEALKALAPVPIGGGTFKPGPRPDVSASQPAGVAPGGAARAQVTVVAFDMDRTEATVGAYAGCVAAGKCAEPQAGGDCNWGRTDRLDHPMNCVSPGEAAAFCAWRGRRLPDEDEWELAARGTEARPFPWGKVPPEAQLCWRRAGTCAAGGHPAGKNPAGVLDLEGNVAEWTTGQVLLAPEPGAKAPASAPGARAPAPKEPAAKTPAPKPATVARGSSYLDTTAARVGVGSRSAHKSFETLPTVGFRCVSAKPAGK
jgi:formylglycine-generating enzyme required for sulfatase activity